MLFNSLSYAIFLPIVFGIYWCFPNKFRWWVLLISSYYFYMSWNPNYVCLILFTTLISWWTARRITDTEDKMHRKQYVILNAIACLGVLFWFKYFNFFSDSVCNMLKLVSIELDPVMIDYILPVGISFYTFQTLSYVIDVYREDVKAEKSLGYYTTFVSFFPQLVAGPIERTRNLLPQIKLYHSFDYQKATYGLKLMTWGFFKKMVIADTLSPYVQTVFNNPHAYDGFSLAIASIFFSIQIYCDFSGYSDIAIGTAKLFGIDLMTNFRNPYFSQSIREFWSKWHISLSTWFRDYVYIPLGGNRVSRIRHNINLLITFLVSGLWHGANWTFVFWGGTHGVLQIIENSMFSKQQLKSCGCLKYVRIIIIFIVCTFAWIFFVSHSFSDAIYVISHIFNGFTHPVGYIKDGIHALNIGKYQIGIIFFELSLLIVYDWYSQKNDVIEYVSKKSVYMRWAVYVSLVLFIIIFSQKGETEFIYFQF